MTSILMIDSSTEACSVALLHQGCESHTQKIAPRQHAELLLPMVNQLLADAKLELSQLDAIGCCIGPGAFTGLRVAIAMTQGLALASDLSCIGVVSLEALANQAFSCSDHQYCLVSLDARMQQVYFALYRRNDEGLPEIVYQPQVIDPESIELSQQLVLQVTNGAVKVGNGWKDYRYSRVIEAIEADSSTIELPQAKHLLVLAEQVYKRGQCVTPEGLQPLYLRNNVAKKSKIEL